MFALNLIVMEEAASHATPAERTPRRAIKRITSPLLRNPGGEHQSTFSSLVWCRICNRGQHQKGRMPDALYKGLLVDSAMRGLLTGLSPVLA